jgi:hypothetical protein
MDTVKGYLLTSGHHPTEEDLKVSQDFEDLS